MGDVIYLDQPTALTLNMFRKSIAYTQTINAGGKYNEVIEKEKSIYKGMFAELFGGDK